MPKHSYWSKLIREPGFHYLNPDRGTQFAYAAWVRERGWGHQQNSEGLYSITHFRAWYDRTLSRTGRSYPSLMKTTPLSTPYRYRRPLSHFR